MNGTIDVVAMLNTRGSSLALVLRDELINRALSGEGGEVHFDWHDGPRVFADVQPSLQLPGGTSTQVAQQLATIGAKPLLALERRDPAMLRLLHPKVWLAPLEPKSSQSFLRVPRSVLPHSESVSVRPMRSTIRTCQAITLARAARHMD